MDSINEKKVAGTFPFESLNRFRNAIPLDTDKTSDYSARSFDNRGKISNIAGSLSSKLGYLQTRLTASSFLSDAFSWQVKTAKTSDPAKLLAKATSSAEEKDYSFEIDSLATVRTTNSNRLDSDDATDFKTGTYSFSLTIGTESTAIDVEIESPIGARATNRSVLLSVERSINRLGLDVAAELKDMKVRDYNPYRENAYKDISYLTISSNTTGEDIEFSISDTSGELIEDLGLDKVSQFGTKNQYRVDGAQSQLNSNNITVESDKVSAYLLGETQTDENLKISVEQGRHALASELSQIINDYNDLIGWIDDNDSVISPSLKKVLFKNLSSIVTQDQTLRVNSNGSSNNLGTSHVDFASAITLEKKNTIDRNLTDIGLALNNNGTIDIGDEFSTSVSSQLREVYDALAGTDGFFTKISEAIDTIHGKSESNYVFALNSILSYDANGTNRQSIYKSNSSSIISFFA
ncbi:MAG: hypothetical protein GY699_18665 [Desulfobacteraceae bacterium]|nr:hypothetical protein [Desulfobacteraceae bacterium]